MRQEEKLGPIMEGFCVAQERQEGMTMGKKVKAGDSVYNVGNASCIDCMVKDVEGMIVQLCPMHAATPLLLAALSKLTKTAIRTTVDIVDFEGATELDKAIDEAWEAIALAEGLRG